MRRPANLLTTEALVEEVRFVLKTLLREDLFGRGPIKLADAESALDRSISVSFSDLAGFLSKHGYVRIDHRAHVLQVSEDGVRVARAMHDHALLARLGEHFAKQLRASVPPPGTQIRASVPPASGGEVIDRRYRRGEPLADGPYGVIYRAEQLALRRAVILKELSGVFELVSFLRRDEILRRFEEISGRQASLDHPGVLKIFDQSSEREFPYVVLEEARGGNLRDRMASIASGRLPVKIGARVLLQICHALHFAHREGVLHLNLKPENILFDALGNVRLADFGLSRLLERPRGARTSQPPVIVSPAFFAYMPPERAEADTGSEPTRTSDVYSVGVLAYQMLTGKLPGRRSLLPSQIRREIPSSFDDVFDRMTRDDPSERYLSFDQVLDALEKVFRSEVQDGTIPIWSKDPSPIRRSFDSPERSEEITSEVRAEPIGDTESQGGE